MSFTVRASDLGRVRTRALGVDLPKIEGISKQYLFGTLFQTLSLGGESIRGSERTADATHPWFVLFDNADWRWRKSVAGNLFFKHILKTGGEFSSTKTRFEPSSAKEIHVSSIGSNRSTYDGWVMPVSPVVAINEAPTYSISDDNLRSIGAQQIYRNLPGKPIVDIGQTLAELKREGIPLAHSLSKLRDYSPPAISGAGKGYLTWQFAWRPIIQDVYALARKIDTADKQWRKYVANARKLERRHFDLPVERSVVTSTVENGGSIYPILPSALCTNQAAPLIRERTTVTTRSFSAAYVYHLPQADEAVPLLVRKALQYQQQFGLEVDPSLIWELIPWSWLVDWFVPIGKFWDAASEFILGNTVLPWAYVSEHTVITDVYLRPSATLVDGTSVGLTTVVYDYKRRISASPFGFGLSWDDLSPYQLSLLAAVGVTRR